MRGPCPVPSRGGDGFGPRAIRGKVFAVTSPGQQLELLAAAQGRLNALAPLLTPLADDFAASGHELYLVGGSVRDALLGARVSDMDFTTDARPETVRRILTRRARAVWDTGIEFGTISAAIPVPRSAAPSLDDDAQPQPEWQVEITTYRADSYDGVTRNPTVTFGDTLEGDLVRRDFTVNAMAVRLLPGGGTEFCDPIGGMDALAEKIIDTPSSPEVSFGDDPLRMLRAARFVSQLGFDLAPRVRESMREMAEQVDRITVERVRTELDKLMLGADPVAGINVLVETGLAERVMPEIPGMQLERDEHMQHKDVYWHSLTVLQQAIDLEDEGPDLVLRWAALLHDIGKPDTRAPKPGGGVTFHHHEVVGAKMARKRMRALKYPKAMIEDVSGLIFLHLRFHGYGDGAWTDSAVRRYVNDAGDLLPRLHKLVRADCTTRNKRRANRLQRNYDSLEQRIAEIAEAEDLARVRPDLDGNDIMEILGVPPGPVVGKAWKYLKELRLDRGPLDPDEARAELKAWWENQQGGN